MREVTKNVNDVGRHFGIFVRRRDTCHYGARHCVFRFYAVARFTDVFFYVTPDNGFVRGPLLALSLMPMAAMLIVNIVGVIRRRKKLSKKYFSGLLLYLIPMTLTMILHVFIAIEIFVVSGMALFALIMYGLILSDNVEHYMNQQREIANQRANIMVLQMRPHFIYNTMTSIYYLCDQDPQLAKQVTMDFTTYLRKNFAAIASEDTIPFAEELEHTRAGGGTSVKVIVPVVKSEEE